MNLLKLLDTLAPEVREAFLASIDDIKSEAQLVVIIAALQRGDLDAAIAALHIRPEFFAPLDTALTAAYLQGGREVLANLPAIADPLAEGALLRAWTQEIRGQRNS